MTPAANTWQNSGVELDAENHAVLVVRQQRRRGGELLHFDLQGRKNSRHFPLWGSRTGTERLRDGGEISTPWTGLPRAQWRTDFQIHGGDLIDRELRDAGRNRRILG